MRSPWHSAHFLLGIPSAVSRTIRRYEVREEVRDYDGTLDFIPMFPVVVEAEGTFVREDGGAPEKCKWRRELLSGNGKTTSKDTAIVRSKAEAKYRAIANGRDTILPLLSYYGTGRLWEEPRQSHGSQRQSRFDGYKNSHEAKVSRADLLAWVERKRLQELETGFESRCLNSWRRAVEACFSEQVSVTYSPSRKRIEVSFAKRGETVGFDNLSHGQRNILSMVGDIAFKAILLNPQLGADAVRQTSGVVLIDEIDLHLHPHWQREIIPALLRTFPLLQFFATTHAPFVVQSLHEGSLLNLDNMDVSNEVYNLDLLSIAETVQNVEIPERSADHIRKMKSADRFMELTRALKGPSRLHDESINAEIDRILEREIEDPGLAALLKIERLAAQKT